jgi:hypothetical protein
MDWVDWHREYEVDSPLRRRLEIVRECLSDAMTAAAPGPVRLIPICAGDGRDVIPVLAAHPRSRDVTATVGVHRLIAAPATFAPGIRLFEFVPERRGD